MTEIKGQENGPPSYPWRQRALYALLALAVVVLQWPMLKGMYYKQFASEVASSQTVAWRTDFAEAQREAARTGKPMLVDFSASWCPPCQVMKHDVWTDIDVGRKVMDGFVPVLLDIDLPANRPIAQRYGIESIPAVLVLGRDGEVKSQAAYMDVAATLEFLTRPGQ